MVNAPFVSIVHRGLVNGAKCLIDGREFASTDPALFEQHWANACEHALALVRAQDGDTPRDLSLPERRNLWKGAQ